MSEVTVTQAEYCDHCERACPAKGYWRCPVCDAEWIEEPEALNPAAIIAAHKRAQALTELAQADAVLLDLPPTPAR